MKNCLLLFALGALSFCATSMRADTVGILNTATPFAVLGASTVTNTGPSVLTGDLGLAPGTSITGFPPGTVLGTVHNDDAVAIQAQADAAAAFKYLAALPFTLDLSGQNLGNQVLTPGVYYFGSSAQLTGPLTLNFEGLSNANIIFQIGSTLTTATSSSVNIINQGLDDNVYYAVGSSATLGTYSLLQGDIIANASISLGTGATIPCGSAIALTGAVTLDTNVINVCSTNGSDVTSGVGTVTPVPEPGSFTLVATGVLGAIGFARRKFFSA